MKNYSLFSGLIVSLVFLFAGCGVSGQLVAPPVLKNTSGKEDIFIKINDLSHSGTITRMLTTKNNELITASMDKSIRVWDTKSLHEKRKILGHIGIEHLGKIFAIALSPDEKYLAVGGYLQLPVNTWDDKQNEPFIFQIFDYKTGKLVKNLYAHISSITDLKFSDDGKYLISSSYDNTIRIWDTKEFKNIKAFGTSIEGGIHNIGIMSKNNNYEIYCDVGYELRKYSLTNYITQKGFPFRIKRFIVLKKSKKIAIIVEDIVKQVYKSGAGYQEKRVVNDIVYILDSNLNIIKTINTGFTNSCLAINEDETQLAVGSSKTAHSIKVYNLKTYKQNSVFIKHKGAISSLVFTKEDEILSSSTENNELIKWTVKQGAISVEMFPKIKTHFDIMSKNTLLTWNDKEDKNEKLFVKQFDIKNFSISKLQSLSGFSTFANRPPSSKRITDGTYKLGFSKGMTRLHLNKLDGSNVFIYQRDASDGFAHTSFGFYKKYLITGGRSGVIDILDLNGNFIATLIGHDGDIESFTIVDNMLATTGSDKTIKFWDISKLQSKYQLLQPLSTLVISNQDWVLWTEEGYFTASENGAKLIGFHVNSKQGIQKEASWVSIDKLYDHFFRPDLVKLKLQGVDISQFTNGLTYEDVLKTPPPSVHISKVLEKDIDKKKRELILHFNVEENDGGGVGTIRIYQEGKLVKTIGEGKINREIANADKKFKEEKLNELLKQKQKEYLAQLEVSASKSINGTLKASELVGDVEPEEITNKEGAFSVILPIKAGKNSISVEAFNKTNTVASYRETIEVNGKIKKRKPKIYVIAAGVNEFEQDNVSKLKYSENDAKTIAKEIKNATEYKTEVTLLTGKNVTKENILKAIAKIKKKAHLEDKIVFYISTHGKAARGRLYLVPQNNKKLKNWINFEELFSEIQSVAALDQIFIIDACESGQASDIMSSVYDAKASVLAKQSGVHVLMATTKGTFAFESADKNVKHGVFTNNILKALQTKGTDKNKNGKISIVELSKTLKEPEYSVNHQFPIIRNVGEDTYIKKIGR